MIRIIAFFVSVSLGLAACAPTTSTSTSTGLGTDGKPLPKLYRIRAGETGKVQFRMLDSVNALRASSGQPPVALNAQLNAAAATHARDMSVQNRPWHFGSDGSSPIDRVRRVGYAGSLVGENISETYETELETLAAWMDQDDTRRTIMSANAADMGFSWFQEGNGKIWWVLVMGTAAIPAPDAAPVPDTRENPAAAPITFSDLEASGISGG